MEEAFTSDNVWHLWKRKQAHNRSRSASQERRKKTSLRLSDEIIILEACGAPIQKYQSKEIFEIKCRRYQVMTREQDLTYSEISIRSSILLTETLKIICRKYFVFLTYQNQIFLRSENHYHVVKNVRNTIINEYNELPVVWETWWSSFFFRWDCSKMIWINDRVESYNSIKFWLILDLSFCRSFFLH